MKKRSAPVPRSRHVLIGITTGADQVEANRIMRVVAEAIDRALPAKTPTYMTTVDALPHELVRK